MPGRPFQSCLEPHFSKIRDWRLQRQTWQQIAEALHDEHGVTVDYSAVCKFFKRRLSPNRRQPLGYPEGAETGEGVSSLTGTFSGLNPPLSLQEATAVQMALEHGAKHDLVELPRAPVPIPSSAPYVPPPARPKKLDVEDVAAMREQREP